MSNIFMPSTEAEAAAVVQSCATGGITLAISGGNTRSGFGHAVNAAATLCSARLSGIVSYHPGEMVMTAKSGTPLAEIEAVLAQNGQRLAFEPVDHRGMMGTTGEPTIGGVFASNASGPGRIVAGAARDSLLGVRFVNGSGEVIHSGGRVMKNVTGLDLVKLLAGSFGTLGFLTEVTFRVLPVAAAVATLVISGLDDEVAARCMAAAMAMPVEVSGAAHLPESVRWRFAGGNLPDGPATVLRLAGRADPVTERFGKLEAVMSRAGSVTRLDHDASLALWREIRDVLPYCDGTQKPLWRVSVAPMDGYRLVAALRLEAGIDAFYDWQGGLVWMRMEAAPEAELLRHYIRALGHGGHATLVRATDTVRASVAAFEPRSAAESLLSARIREKLDPVGIFNPGRMGS